MSASETLSALCADFWEWRVAEWPELGSFCGDYRYDDRLNDQTEAAFTARGSAAREYLLRAEKIDSTTLEFSEQVSLQLLTDELKSFIDGISTKAYVFPINNMEGIHVDFEQLTSWMKFETVADFEKYLSRLRCLPKRISQDKEMMELGIKLGLTFSKYCVTSVPGQLDQLDVPVYDTVYLQPFRDADSALALTTLRDQASAVVEKEILPAVRELKDFIQQTYLPACRPSAGLWSVPGGRDLYTKLLRWHTTPDLSPQDVHDLGKQEVARIRQEMMEVLKTVGFKGDLKEFIQELKTNDKFFYNDKDTLLKGFRDIVEEIRPTLPKLFHKMPKAALSVAPFPPSKESGPVAYYLAGTLDGARPGRFYVNTANLRESAKYDMMTLALHEGEPGHHFQGMYAIEASNLPLFRRYFEDMCYSLAPCHFSIFCGYGEGWGLYCEYLGKELGLYSDPYSLFGHLSFEMFRACRLVADTGLHSFEWTFEQAVDLFLENTAAPRSDIVKECNRYCTIPGQACGYKVGQIKIKQLREKASKALGERFDVRDFHEEVLQVGMVPLAILETVIDKYISRTQQQ